MVMLGSCGMIDGQRDGRFRAGSRVAAGPHVSDIPVKIGAPYTVAGVTYIPADVQRYEAFGYASWYGEELSGNRTANGEMFDPGGISAAHRTLPLPSYVEVTALSTGKTILLRVNDRGPFTQAREIDLSRGAAQQLGILGSGATAVRILRVEPPEAERAILRAGRRVAERRTANGTALARSRDQAGFISAPPAAASILPQLSPGGFYTVQLASFSARNRAEALAERIGARVMRTGSLWRVNYGPYASPAEARVGVEYAASKGFRDAVIIANDDTSMTSSR